MIRTIEPRESGQTYMMNPTRQAIFQYLCRFPCKHIRAMEKDLKLKLPTLIWHLRLLEKNGFITSAPFRHRKVFYPTGLIPKNDIPIFALLENAKVRNIAAALYKNKELTQKEIMILSDTYQQSVQWYLAQMKELSLINYTKKGRNTIYTDTGRIEEVKEHCNVLYDDFIKDLMIKLRKDGVAPKVIREDAKGTIIQLDLGERKHSLKIERV